MSGATEADGSVEAGPAPPQDIHREKPTSTVVRVLTVLAYLLSVSLAAILLSVYYICVWKSPDLPKAGAHEMLSARRADPNDYDTALTNEIAPYNFTGGSNITVNETATLPILDKFANLTNTIENSGTTMDSSENATLLPLQETENSYIDAANTTDT